MSKIAFQVHQWPAGEAIPWPLLLDADPNRPLVQAYLNTGQLWGLQLQGQWAGVYVLVGLDKALAEVKNVAVAEDLQGQGWGTILLRHAMDQARQQGYSRLRIATADASTGQQRLYRKLGFADSYRVANHFVTHYPDPLYENGVRCRDQVVLEMAL